MDLRSLPRATGSSDAFVRLLIDLLIIQGRPAADRDLELLVLRQELLVLRRTARRPRWRRADRIILAALGRQLPASALLLVQPATILGWHRALVRRRWAAFGRRRGPGRPPLPAECQELVLKVREREPALGLCAHSRRTAQARPSGLRHHHPQ